jgi:hypothetical protein
MELITGVLESTSLIPEMDLWITVDYALAADSWFMEVTTTISTSSETVDFEVGDLIMGSQDAADAWVQNDGLDEPGSEPFEWTGFIGRRNELALAVFSIPGESLNLGTVGALLTSVIEMGLGYGETATLTPDTPIVHRRLYGVAPDLATLTDEWLTMSGADTELASGTVTAPDGPVPGARVSVLVDNAPYTMALTDAEGHFSAKVPTGHAISVLADGRGPGIVLDVASGAGAWSPYAAAGVQERVAASYSQGAPPIPAAQGRGFGTTDDPLTLLEPATVTIHSADGTPFEARLEPWDTPDRDSRLVMDRASGDRIIGWARDGELDLAVEPGTYTLIVHRGPRYEAWTQTLEAPAGSHATIDVDLALAWEIDGWWFADPHMHAAPSGDGSISMEARLLSAAGLGLDLHFGTDHDHVADYRPLLTALDLDPWLTSVVANEVSPVTRGHLNMYPLVPSEAPNGGAWPWWSEGVSTTEEQMAALRAHHPGAIIQSNHPLDSGVAELADWSPGKIGKSDRWSSDFEAMEVLNSDEYAEYLELFIDLTSRGLTITPVGVSDSHGATSGNPGLNGTLIKLGQTYSDEGLVQAMRQGATVVSHGVGLSLSIDPGSTITGSSDLVVQLHRASWVGVDSVSLLLNGEPVEVITEGLDDPITFVLAPISDAWYVVVADGSTGLSPVWPNETAWAMTSPIRVDVDGDGWDPPLPPLEIDDR